MRTLIDRLFPRRATLARYRRALQVERAARLQSEKDAKQADWAREIAVETLRHYRRRCTHLEDCYRMALADTTRLLELSGKEWHS